MLYNNIIAFPSFIYTKTTSCQEFASQFGLEFCIQQKHQKPRGNRLTSASVYLNGQRPGLSPAERAVMVGRQRIAITCAAAVCLCAHVHAWVRDVFAIYDNNI